jgi:hypothetical protein
MVSFFKEAFVRAMETSQNDLIAHAITSLLDVLTINKTIHQYRDLIRLYARSARTKFQQHVEDDDFDDATPLDALCRYFDQPELLRDKFELLSANKLRIRGLQDFLRAKIFSHPIL